MANDVHTIIIRDETIGKGVNNQSINANQVDSNGNVRTNKVKKPHIHSGRPKQQGSVEHNRYSRIWNSSMNKITGGVWEKTDRFSGATGGILLTGSTVGLAIIGQFVFNTAYKELNNYLKQVEEQNEKNILKIKTGTLKLTQSYDTSVNFFSGKVKYKNNR